MKKTLKKLISLVAVAATLATSSVVALADNEYLSYSNDFSTATGVTITDNLNYVTANRGDVVMSVANGVLTSTRTHYDNETSGRRSNSTEASIVFDKSISKGAMQTKFDFTMTGGTNQGFVFTFTGFQPAGTGLAISKTNVKVYYPNSTGISTPVYYNEDNSAWIEEGEGYSATVTLDLATATYKVKIVKIADTSDAKSFTVVIPEDRWGTATKGAITGIALRSRRDHDLSTGTITFDNLSVDSYTKYNYEIGGIYKSANGLETNKPVDGFELKNYTLNKFTNFVNPNATFITAGYDANGRMTDVVVTPIAEMETNFNLPEVEGDVVKAFVFDMSDASPMMSAFTGEVAEPARTMRKLDFDSVSSLSRKEPYRNGYEANTVANISTYDIIYAGTWAGVAYDLANEGENKFLKVERSSFKSGSTIYWWDNTANAWGTGTSGAENNHFGIKLDKASNDVKVTLKFKFAGTENASQIQYLDVNMGGQLVRISRNQNGEGNVACSYSGTNCSWTDMKADEWYTLTAIINPTGFNCSVAGNFVSGYAVKSGANTKTATESNYISIGSPRDADVVPMSLAEVKTKTSVWYIDDIVVEY